MMIFRTVSSYCAFSLVLFIPLIYMLGLQGEHLSFLEILLHFHAVFSQPIPHPAIAIITCRGRNANTSDPSLFACTQHTVARHVKL